MTVKFSFGTQGGESICIQSILGNRAQFVMILILLFFPSPKAPIYNLEGHEDKVMCCDWSNPRYMVSGGADKTVRIFKSRLMPTRMEGGEEKDEL